MPLQKFQNTCEINISEKGNSFEFVTDNKITYCIYTNPGKKIIPGFIFSSEVICLGFFPFLLKNLHTTAR